MPGRSWVLLALMHVCPFWAPLIYIQCLDVGSFVVAISISWITLFQLTARIESKITNFIYMPEVIIFFNANVTAAMHVQNHSVIFLKYHITIIHGTDKKHLSFGLDYPPSDLKFDA